MARRRGIFQAISAPEAIQIMERLLPDQIEQVRNALRARGILYARLFGSAARGAMSFDSDVDLAVSADAPLTSQQKRELIEDVSAIVLRPVDVVDFRTAHGAVFDEALDGYELFCDSEEAKAEAQYRRVTVIQDDLEFARQAFDSAKHRMFVP